MKNTEAEKRAAILAEAMEYPVLFDFHEELLDCIRRGDSEGLEEGLNDAFDAYQNSVMLDVDHARSIFVFNLCLAYYSAHTGGLPMAAGQKLCTYYHMGMLSREGVAEIQVFLKEMLRDFARNVAQVRGFHGQAVPVRRTMEYIHAHIDEPLSLSQLAEAVGVSISTLKRQFLRAVGKSVSDYIRAERIRRAKFLLENSAMTGAQISAALGFCSQSYFIRQFRAETGVTPKEFTMRPKTTAQDL